MKTYRYTAILRSISGNVLETRHYPRKSELLKDMTELLPLCYSLEVMEHLVWRTREITEEEE